MIFDATINQVIFWVIIFMLIAVSKDFFRLGGLYDLFSSLYKPEAINEVVGEEEKCNDELLSDISKYQSKRISIALSLTLILAEIALFHLSFEKLQFSGPTLSNSCAVLFPALNVATAFFAVRIIPKRVPFKITCYELLKTYGKKLRIQPYANLRNIWTSWVAYSLGIAVLLHFANGSDFTQGTIQFLAIILLCLNISQLIVLLPSKNAFQGMYFPPLQLALLQCFATNENLEEQKRIYFAMVDNAQNDAKLKEMEKSDQPLTPTP